MRSEHPYNPSELEPRWQARWEELGLHTADLSDGGDPRPKFYLLTMYPYPSGDLHIGHWSIIAPTDVAGRYKRMQGYNVFFPFGFDAFGLPAENAAIKSGIHPREWTYKNIETMRRQVRLIGAALDWEQGAHHRRPLVLQVEPVALPALHREGPGLSPRWRRWTGAPRTRSSWRASRSWAPNRVCWRCSTPVIKRDLEQWFFRTTKYADEMLSYEGLIYPEPIKVMQTNWIGRSEGAEIAFKVAADDQQPGGDEIRVFTTRPDTLFGATFMVLAPEHPLVDKLTAPGQEGGG